MNKHFQELARIVGQSLAQRWMQRCTGQAAGDDGARAKADHTTRRPPADRRRRRPHHPQQK